MSSASRLRGLGLAVLLGAGLLAVPVASLADPVSLEITVVHKDGAAGDDACAAKARRILGKEFAGAKLRCLDVKKRKVALNDVWNLKLPTGRSLAVRPMDVSAEGVLVAVDMEKSLQGDFRVQKGKPLVLGGESHEGGKLVVILEPNL